MEEKEKKEKKGKILNVSLEREDYRHPYDLKETKKWNEELLTNPIYKYYR